jgi:hypothetical protein
MKKTLSGAADVLCGCFRCGRRTLLIWAVILGGFLAVLTAKATDQLTMTNGDTYQGKVLLVNADSVVLQSEVQGKVTLPRAKVASIQFGPSAAVVPSASLAPRAAQTNPVPQALAGTAPPGLSNRLDSVPALGGDQKSLEKLQSDLLSTASPEAKAKFTEMLTGLMTGKLSMNDLRTQAKTTADQLRAYKQELGPEAGGMLDTYLSILDQFVQEGAGQQAKGAKAPAAEKQSQ